MRIFKFYATPTDEFSFQNIKEKIEKFIPQLRVVIVLPTSSFLNDNVHKDSIVSEMKQIMQIILLCDHKYLSWGRSTSSLKSIKLE